jgi:hypothetical protein
MKSSTMLTTASFNQEIQSPISISEKKLKQKRQCLGFLDAFSFPWMENVLFRLGLLHEEIKLVV